MILVSDENVRRYSSAVQSQFDATTTTEPCEAREAESRTCSVDVRISDVVARDR
jgi:hypothetical protein